MIHSYSFLEPILNKQTQFHEKMLFIRCYRKFVKPSDEFYTDDHVLNSKALFMRFLLRFQYCQLVLDTKRHLFGCKTPTYISIPVCVG